MRAENEQEEDEITEDERAELFDRVNVTTLCLYCDNLYIEAAN